MEKTPEQRQQEHEETRAKQRAEIAEILASEKGHRGLNEHQLLLHAALSKEDRQEAIKAFREEVANMGAIAAGQAGPIAKAILSVFDAMGQELDVLHVVTLPN